VPRILRQTYLRSGKVPPVRWLAVDALSDGGAYSYLIRALVARCRLTPRTRAPTLFVPFSKASPSASAIRSPFPRNECSRTSIRLGGGGARSPLWRQIQADRLRPRRRDRRSQEGAPTAPSASRCLVWRLPTVDAACAATVRVASRINPQPAAVATLNASTPPSARLPRHSGNFHFSLSSRLELLAFVTRPAHEEQRRT